ncbi:DNA repair protein RecN [Candidatus Rariloculus sp.]|uniref:DNA repair protein RecN n=1 Tax=Candidatus Rariloculus sp. TaxID=3101265 RepID=UPI003D12959B
MLSFIRIKNYAVIDELELEFRPGFSVLTGETGAGKSILVDALGLALGDRADAGAIRQGASRAEISALFECPSGHPAIEWLRERDLDDEDSCSLRRSVSAEGRSRAFVNNRPVTLQDLKTLGALLVDIHGQHAHQSLLTGATQRRVLDVFGGLENPARETAGAFAAWQTAATELKAQSNSAADRSSRLELLRFELGELEALGLEDAEPEHLHAERKRLANVDRLMQSVSAALDYLDESESGSAHSALVKARRSLAEIVEHDTALAEPSGQLETAEIELREAASTLLRYRDRLEANPERLEIVNNRLNRIRTLARRHGVDESRLPETAEHLRDRINELDAGEQSLAALSESVDQAARDYREFAGALSEGRKRAAASLAAEVSCQLKELGLPHGALRVAVDSKPGDAGDATGMDRIEFEVRLNPGQPFGPLSRVASGGELSRIGLALEVVATGASPIPTYVFDEVDAGIGGGVAEIVGRRLRQIAERRQVLCVTHLAQVASQSAEHYRVTKHTDGSTSRANVLCLSDEERVDELSRMLGGIEITETARAHAQEMIERAST